MREISASRHIQAHAPCNHLWIRQSCYPILFQHKSDGVKHVSHSVQMLLNLISWEDPSPDVRQVLLHLK